MSWKQELKKRSYLNSENCRVLDDKDALEIAQIAQKESWNKCLLEVSEIIDEKYQGDEMEKAKLIMLTNSLKK